jgi:hypothetical protein
MTQSSRGGEPSRVSGFDYFMLRVTRSGVVPEELTGVIERLGTGEKWAFATGEQLLGLIGSHPSDGNMQAVSGSGNPPAARPIPG